MNPTIPRDSILIPKGDDFDALGRRTIVINLTTDLDLSGATANFTLLSYSQDYTTEELASKQLQVKLSAAVTSSFPIGRFCGVFKIFDADGKVLTATSRIPFRVIPAGSDVEVRDGTVNIKTVEGEGEDPIKIDIAFYTDYSLITNKPTINGKTLEGDMSGADLGLADETSVNEEIARAKVAEEELARQVSTRITAYLNTDEALVLTTGTIPEE